MNIDIQPQKICLVKTHSQSNIYRGELHERLSGKLKLEINHLHFFGPFSRKRVRCNIENVEGGTPRVFFIVSEF